MKATYNDFIAQNQNCTGLEFNAVAEQIFDFLNRDENIIKMLESCDQGKTALAGCVRELEAYYKTLNMSVFDLKDKFNRTAVGRMIKTVIAPFGYEVTVKKSLGQNLNLEYFKAASCYELTGKATMRVVKRVETV